MTARAWRAYLGAGGLVTAGFVASRGLPELQAGVFLAIIGGWVLLLGLTLARLSRLMVDVDTYRTSQQRLREAELRYRTLVEQMPGAVYIAWFGTEGRWTYVSPKIRDLYGLSPEEWLAHEGPWNAHVHPEDRDRAIEDESEAAERGGPLSSQYRIVDRAGNVRWIQDEAVLVTDEDGSRHWQGVMTDVTETKLTEHRLRAAAEERRRLLSRLVSAHEEERARIANDIHDDPIQQVTAVGMRLALLRAKLPEELRPTADELDRSIQMAIGRLRGLMFELRPAALEREGIETALRQYLLGTDEEEQIVFTIVNRMATEPSLDVRAAAYRVAQEALMNVRKHASASRVDIVLEDRNRGFALKIRDDGVGFECSGGSPPGHLGLTAMRERAELAGGTCQIRSEPGLGTTVELWLPDPQKSSRRLSSGATHAPGAAATTATG
jgi:PAS domain S-box-containing protein